jgi:hypothetical protein
MQFKGGNRAIRDHLENEEKLLLFEQVRRKGKKKVKFVGEMICRGYRIESKDSEGSARDAIVFELEPVDLLRRSSMPTDLSPSS